MRVRLLLLGVLLCCQTVAVILEDRSNYLQDAPVFEGRNDCKPLRLSWPFRHSTILDLSGAFASLILT